MKLAIVLPTGSLFSTSRPNSMETVVRTLAEASRYRDTTRIFCDEGVADPVALPLHRLPEGLNRHDRIRALTEALKQFDPDCVEYHQQIGIASAVSRRLPGRHHVLYRHNAIRPGRNPVDRLRHRRRHAVFSRFIFVSEAARAEFAAEQPHLADRARAIRNPIDAAPWFARPEDREPLIAFSGRAMPEKGLDLLCAALPRVLDRHPEWRAALVLGDWDMHARWAGPHVERLVQAFGDRIEIQKSAPLGAVTAVMQRAAIAVTPSVWAEPLGLTALEAHAAGAAVVSSGRGGLREASGPHARYVTDLSPAGLAEAIERLIAEPDERLAMARAGQAFATTAHSPAARASELDAMRAELIVRPPVRGPFWSDQFVGR